MQTAIDDKNAELTTANEFLQELQEEYNMAYALFEEVNSERKAIEEEARAREVANQRNQIYEGVLNDTTWFPGVATAIAGRVTYFQEAA
jgi:translation initiation factor 2 alpha subunit (eIF-2alpha)